MYRSLAHEALMFEPFIKRIFNVTLDMAQIGPWIFFLQNAQIMSQNKHLRPGCIQNFHWRFLGLSGLFENLYQELIQDAA